MPASPLAPNEVCGHEWHRDDLWPPVVVLDRDALVHNLDRMSDWCAQRGMSLAPHGKTTMAPQLWNAQLARGAWGITAANAAQARVMHRFGVRRVVIANEVIDPAGLAWLAGLLHQTDAEVFCLVDSVAGVERIEAAVAAADAPRPQPVLVELGLPNGRTGCRSVEDVAAVAARAARSGRLQVVGVEGFEGVLSQGREPDQVAAVRAFCADLANAAVACDKEGSLEGDERIVTGGGSSYFDLVAEAIDEMPDLSAPIRPVLRSGCYLTHDHVSYERGSPWRSGNDDDPLRPAMTAHARVLSVPEPGLALAGVGKRDVAFDLDMPVVLAVRRDGQDVANGAGSADVTIAKLNDQHAFLQTGNVEVQVGDAVELGLSHPCTTFDKWPLLPVVDRDGAVVDAIRTLF